MQAMLDLCVSEFKWLFQNGGKAPLHHKVNDCRYWLKEYNNNNELKILHENNEAAGFVAYTALNNTEGSIRMLAIKQDFRGKGYAKALLKDAIGELQNKKLHSIYISSDKSNFPALKLYQKFGFKKSDKIHENPDLIRLEYDPSSTDKWEI